MFPAQTSLIPITVALTKFLEANGSGGLYDYWYLGSTPFKYLSGPVLPYFLVLLKGLIPAFSYFELALVLVGTSLIIGALGWGMLAWKLSGKRSYCLIVSLIVLFAPWHLVSALGLAETSAVLAGALTPWVIFAFAKVESGPFDKAQGKKWKVRSVIVAAISFSILLLTNTTASVSAIIGISLISFSTFNFQLSILKRILAVVLLGWILALWWYSPGYWLTVWGAPGIGGKNLVGVLITLANFLRGFLPVVAVILIVFWKIKPRTAFEKFALGWVVLFGSLTLFRFMADWDFWMDWTAWMGEVEVGLALIIAGPVSRFIPAFAKASAGKPASYGSAAVSLEAKRSGIGNPSNRATSTILSLRSRIWFLVLGIYVIGGWGLAWENKSFWLPRADISQTVEYKIADWFSSNLTIKQFNNSTIFLSGSTAFWLNSLVDIKQVRGGRDEGSVDSNWREVVWEVREGRNGRESVRALKSVGVDFLVVHTDKSGEYYHDFKYPQKFEGMESLKKVYDHQGDVIYQIK